MCPRSEASVCSLNTWLTRPRSLYTSTCEPSPTAMPEASWPRCCKAYRPQQVSLATSSPGAQTPKTPHSSRGTSRAPSAALAEAAWTLAQSGSSRSVTTESSLGHGAGVAPQCKPDSAWIFPRAIEPSHSYHCCSPGSRASPPRRVQPGSTPRHDGVPGRTRSRAAGAEREDGRGSSGGGEQGQPVGQVRSGPGSADPAVVQC